MSRSVRHRHVPTVLALVAGAMAIAPSVMFAQQTTRALVSLDTGWQYAPGSDRSPGDREITAAPEDVTLPHTWNAFDATDLIPEYRRSVGWYRRSLDVRQYPAGARLFLYFEGANTVADVIVNGRRAGGHVGGYVGFEVEVTRFVKRDAPNDIMVKVSNTDDLELIPSSRSDFVIYGGLTRNVWLRVVPPVHVRHVSVRTPAVTRDAARVVATVTIASSGPTDTGTAATATIEARLVSPAGRIVARSSQRRAIDRDSMDVTLVLPSFRHPSLWSPAHPSLYRLVVTLGGAGIARDSVEEKVGLRFYEFREHGPFYLNGERLLLRGTQRHEERALYGGALPDTLQIDDIAAIKAMGANFVRLAHYPQAPAVYRAADSLGVLVWDELPWDRGGAGDATWRENTKRLLREQIRQNENHPSIILWSLGNEVQDVIEADKKGDTPTLRAFLSELKAIATSLDPSRPTAMRKFDAGADIVDVYSPSIWAGWYRGVYKDYEKALSAAQAKYPRMLHMEYGADAHYGRHTETPITGEGLRLDPGVEEAVGKPVANIARDGDWSESYQTDLLEWHLMVSERQPNHAGGAQWVFRDFATPLRPENPIPYVNEKGLTTRDGIPKDAWYLYRSWWTDSPRFAYIVSHSWDERGGGPKQLHAIRVYSNCTSVELLLNHESRGVRQRVPSDFPAQGLRWNLAFNAGANGLTARCTGRDDGAVTDSMIVHYGISTTNPPVDIALTLAPLPNGHVLVTATLVDRDGALVLGASDRIYFDRSGGGYFTGDQGTPTGSRVIEAANGRAAIEVSPPHGNDNPAIITVRTQNLNGAQIGIPAVRD
ncbi:MAG: glycoside hydrolase family 2 TIM barrel-domain containing protein [Gemmatimonadaceae bacterium]